MKNSFVKLSRSKALCLMVAWACAASLTIKAQPVADYKLITGDHYIQAKNYYLLTLLQSLPEIKSLIEKDSLLAGIALNKRVKLEASVNECKGELLCYTESVLFNEQDIQRIGQRLTELLREEPAFVKLVNNHIRKSGTYVLFQNTSDAELLVRAWEQDAKGVNNTIRIYGMGGRPNYPLIDSIGFDVRKKNYLATLHDCVDVLKQERRDVRLFFSIPLQAALLFLEINERSEAADYEPMITTVNKAAFNKVHKIDWRKYKYSVILVPGAGPDTHERALSEGGILRCRIAALRYFEGAAPFIVVSGGRVHPFKTKFSEAFEMKKYLMETLTVPESAIIMEPHARHTTTNMRNCARLIFRYGIPMDKPAIVSTVKSQSFYITNDAFKERCRKEINHVPYTLGNRLSDTEFEFLPTLEALHIDADEPLDP